MKYIIPESKINQIIYDFIKDRYYPDYNWGPELHDFYRKDVKKHGAYDFMVNDKLAYRYYGEYDGYDYLYLLEVEDWIANELTSIFNDLWMPIFIKWFEDNSGLEVKDFEIETI
jgi:hypothetical protein